VKDLNFREYDEAGKVAAPAHKALENAQNEQREQQKPAPLHPMSTEIRKQDHKLVAFETVGQLGRGAFGVVCLVRYRLSNKCYAVKAINKRMVVQQKHVSKVIRERENLVLCSRDREAAKWVVPLHAAFQDERNLYLMMDFLPGGELFSMLPFKLREAQLIAAQVTLALIAIHSLGIIHRDLKPENLLVTRDGHVRVGDFGLSKRVVDRTFTFCGTPDYMAPEVIQNLGHNKAVDYWALGCLLYEMFVGDAPFYRRGAESKVFERILRPRVRFPCLHRLSFAYACGAFVDVSCPILARPSHSQWLIILVVVWIAIGIVPSDGAKAGFQSDQQAAGKGFEQAVGEHEKGRRRSEGASLF
jgi:serine/threonine protein kinase